MDTAELPHLTVEAMARVLVHEMFQGYEAPYPEHLRIAEAMLRAALNQGGVVLTEAR